MSKLFKLKRWLTLPEAAIHLTQIFGETVSEADILQLALDGKLNLSVVFVDTAFASFCEPISESEVEYEKVPTLDGKGEISLPIGDEVIFRARGQIFRIRDSVFCLDGDDQYGLTMFGGERGDIERKYWQLVGGPHVPTENLDGTFVSQQGRIFQLKDMLPKSKEEKSSFYPLGGLPDGSVIVVTPTALLDLEKSIDDTGNSQEKPLGTRERDTLLSIIAALCQVAEVPYEKPAKAAGVIQSTAAQMGISIGETTIENHLKKIPDALATRMK